MLVQCKHWRARKVGVTTLRELYGVMAARGAAHGAVMTTGNFTADAREFARGRSLTLVDGDALQRALSSVPTMQVLDGPPPAPRCPACGSAMRDRVARQGPNPGTHFWGCEAFPRCRTTLPMSDPRGVPLSDK
jgi:restriction system protein